MTSLMADFDSGALLHSFTPSLLHSFTPSLLHSFTPSLPPSSLLHSFTSSLPHFTFYSLTPSLLHSFTPSLLHSLTPSLLRFLTPSLPPSFTPSLLHSRSSILFGQLGWRMTSLMAGVDSGALLHSFTPSLLHSFTPCLLHSLTPSLPHSFTPSLLHSFTPSLPHSFTPSLLVQAWKSLFQYTRSILQICMPHLLLGTSFMHLDCLWAMFPMRCTTYTSMSRGYGTNLSVWTPPS